MSRLSQNGAKTVQRTSILASNPVMRRLKKVDEYDAENHATYGGILSKTIFFLVMTIVGIVLQVMTSNLFAHGEAMNFNIKGFQFELYPGEAAVLVGSFILGLVFLLVATFAKKTTPVTGSLYCITEGYFISFLVFKVLRGFEYLGSLALALTLLIVLVMAILYTTGVIKVNKKFRMVMLTLFVSMVAISILTGIAYLIPFTRPLVQAITGNLVISIGGSILFIIIGALFLISDFAVIDMAVTQRFPKKYEWQASFGLAFTVIWLYLKVLDLLMTIFGKRN